MSEFQFRRINFRQINVQQYYNDVRLFFGYLLGVKKEPKISQGNGVNWASYNTHAGSRITANNTTFLNNKFDAFFTPYAQNNSSSFNFCSFITDENLRSALVPHPIHINLWSNRGIQIRASRFENVTPLLEEPVNRGTGIHSVNSNFIVGTFPNQAQSQFNKLRTGSFTTASNRGTNYGVYNTQFNRNFFGIRSRGNKTALSATIRSTYLGYAQKV